MSTLSVSLGAQLLRRWREQRGLTQEEAGRLIGVDLVRVSKFERGALRPGRRNAGRIEQATRGVVPVTSWDEPAAAASAKKAS